MAFCDFTVSLRKGSFDLCNKRSRTIDSLRISLELWIFSEIFKPMAKRGVDDTVRVMRCQW